MKCWFFKRKKRGKFGINNKTKSNHIRSVRSFKFFCVQNYLYISKILYDLKCLKWLKQKNEHQTNRHWKNR